MNSRPPRSRSAANSVASCSILRASINLQILPASVRNSPLCMILSSLGSPGSSDRQANN
jgi:hypothetical protein